MTTALATSADVVKSLGRPFQSTDESARSDTLLILASTAYENVADYKFAPGTYTIGRRVHQGKVHLPGKKPTVTAVRMIDQLDGSVSPITGFTIHGSVIYGLQGVRMNHPLRQSYVPLFVEIDFTIDATLAPIPPEIVTLVANCVARTLSGPPVGATGESAGPFHVSYANSSGDIYISKNDRLILSRWGGFRA